MAMIVQKLKAMKAKTTLMIVFQSFWRGTIVETQVIANRICFGDVVRVCPRCKVCNHLPVFEGQVWPVAHEFHR